MRHLPTGRGQHHKATALTRRLFTFSEGSGTFVRDLIDGGTPLTTNNGWATGGWLGPTYATFNGVDDVAQGGGAGADAATLTANTWTIGLVVRRRANQAGVIFCVGGNGATAATNVLVRLKTAADGECTVEWESGVNVLRSAVVPTYRLPLDRWQYVHLVRLSSTELGFCAGGRLVATLDMVAANASGTSSIWTIGADQGAASGWFFGDVGSLYLEADDLPITDRVTDLRRATLQAFATSVHARVRIENGLGDLVDVTDLEGHDWLEALSINESSEDPCATLKVELAREIDFLSLASLMTSSKLNVTDPMDLDSYEPFIDLQREVYADFARTPYGHEPVSGDWVNRFFGHVDDYDDGPDPMWLEARDPGGRLVDDFLDEDLDMPLTSGGHCVADPDTGERRASLEEAIEDVIGVPVWAPTAANLCLIPWEQAKDSKMAVARKIAGVKAWDFGYTFDESPSQLTWRPTLIDPNRERLDADGAMTADDYERMGKCGKSVYDIRNRIMLTVPLKTNRNGDLIKIPRTFPYVDDVSRDRYGGFYRTLFLTEGDTSPIDEESEADAMGEGILSDFSEPTLVAEVPVNECFFEAELRDVYTYLGDNVHYTADQTLATSAINLGYANGRGDVGLGVRGKPTTGVRRWLAKDARPGMNPQPWGTGGSSNVYNVGHGIDRRMLIQLFDYGSHSVRQGIGLKGSLVKNPDFDRWTLGNGYCPDGWYGNAIDITRFDPTSTDPNTRSLPGNVQIAETAQTAQRSIYFPRNVLSGNLVSEAFQVEEGKLYALECVMRQDNSGLGLQFNIDWYDSDKVFISTAILGKLTNGTLSVFERRGPALEGGDGSTPRLAPAGARFARLAIGSYPGSMLGSPIPNVADFYLDYASVLAVPFEVDATLTNAITPVTDNVWTDLTVWTETRDYGNVFDAATGVWTCPEDSEYSFSCRVAGRVIGSNNTTFETLNARLYRLTTPIGEIERSPTASYIETQASNPSTGFATVVFSDYFRKGEQVKIQALLGRVTGISPVRAFTAARLKIKQRPMGT